MSARVSGHALRGEGAGHHSSGKRIWPPDRALAHGKCECGALSPAVLTNTQRKRWHKWHKELITAGGER